MLEIRVFFHIEFRVIFENWKIVKALQYVGN